MSGSASMPAPSMTEKTARVLRVGRTMAYDHVCLTRDTGGRAERCLERLWHAIGSQGQESEVTSSSSWSTGRLIVS